MLRNILTLLVALPALWLSIQVFGSIVTGEIAFTGFDIKRDGGAARFWLAVVALALLCCVLFGAALAVFVGVIV